MTAKLDEETNQWTDLELLPFNLELYSTAHPALSPDNKKLYFASDREEGYGLSDLYVVDIKEDGSFSEPRNLGDKINTAGRDTFPFVAKDGTLYYSSDGFVNYGLLDIFKSDIINNPDAESVNIGEPFNSSFDDFAYIFDTDTEEGYLSSNREGGKGSDDIYTFNTYICQQSIEGVVRDELTEEVIPDAIVKLIDNTGKVIAEITTDANGKYKFSNQLCEKTYTVVASKDDYKDDQETVTTTDENDKVNIADLMLTPLIIDNQIVINPIFFDFDKWNIRTDAQFELALIYTEGLLVKQNLKKAFSLTHKAAKKGLASAQYNLAIMYANGTGTKQDDFKASRWYKAAANQNYALAQYNLALLYSEGKGVEKSTEMSYVWNTIAAWNGYPDANKSRIIDERELSNVKRESGFEKANQIFTKIKEQERLKAEMAKNKGIY